MELFLELRNNTYDKPSNSRFQLHVHDEYEIYLFLEGDTRYIVEANSYHLTPGDVIIIRKNQMHRAFHLSEKRYQSLVMWVSPEFFAANHCEEYEEPFMHPEALGSKIEAETVRSSGLYDAFMRLRKYSDGCTAYDRPVVRGIVMEILYLLRKTKAFSVAEEGNTRLKPVFSYINANFTKPLTLEMIAEQCFISKYHLCHIFPEVTGLTVHRYITQKRLAYAHALIRDGMSLGSAAASAGFSTYSSFYRAYLDAFGHMPLVDK